MGYLMQQQNLNSSGYLRDQSLLDVSPHLFTSHHDNQLSGQFNQTAARVTLNTDRMIQEYGKDK